MLSPTMPCSPYNAIHLHTRHGVPAPGIICLLQGIMWPTVWTLHLSGTASVPYAFAARVQRHTKHITHVSIMIAWNACHVVLQETQLRRDHHTTDHGRRHVRCSLHWWSPCYSNRTLLHCSAHLLGACTSAHNVESARRGRQVGAATTTVPYNAKVAAKPPHNRSGMDSGTMTPSTVLPAPVKSMLLRVTTDPPWTPVP